MAIEILVPRLGWSMDEGVFGQWLIQEGEMVNEGNALFELESDKATQEVESFDSGILRLPADAPQPGDTVKVGQCLGFLCDRDEAVPTVRSSDTNEPHDGQASDPVVPVKSQDVAANNANKNGGAPTQVAFDETPATPIARRLARKLGVDIRQLAGTDHGNPITEKEVRAVAKTPVDDSQGESGNDLERLPRRAVSPRAAARAVQLGIGLSGIVGTGRGGRIRERDVLAAAQRTATQRTPLPLSTQPSDVQPSAALLDPHAPKSGSSAEMSLRKAIAARMLAATQQTAQVTMMAKADATQLVSLREEFKRTDQLEKIQVPTITELFVKLVAAALRNHSDLLHQWGDNGLVVPDGIHISVAVDTEHGLLAPVMRDVPSLPLAEVTRQMRALVQRARAHQLSSNELQGGTFTISNLGGYRVDGFTPILNLPQSAILGMGQIRREPTVVGDAIAIRDQVSLSLTFDHRVHDGASPAAFLQTLCEIVEEPTIWLMT